MDLLQLQGRVIRVLSRFNSFIGMKLYRASDRVNQRWRKRTKNTPCSGCGTFAMNLHTEWCTVWMPKDREKRLEEACKSLNARLKRQEKRETERFLSSRSQIAELTLKLKEVTHENNRLRKRNEELSNKFNQPTK